ncbi:M20 family metallopeptidase [Vibrio sp. SS-MA-C1-2]|uniref:M20 aminoacylase family protein n=1 Tax=Vibrio sp. SS-MA-C1-2 TaxID=2908646 RepID=UPI001F1673BC|nr:M20 aminoacylase family protein [Vibrio sp. SS-MA-C1-2]UJF18349.1 M20 family metallopeptidase [Vibrio sp. SS-MA-C1-2]
MEHRIQTGSERHNEMINWRHDIHAHPEIAYQEFRTSDKVAKILTNLGLVVDRGLGGTGVVATLKGKLGQGKTIGLRADMDALPMTELNTFSHCSTHQGKMHACGHDGHTTMLLGAASYLASSPEFKERNFAGTIHFIFQPAEENEAGAKAMIEDGLFDKFPVDAIFGLHNWPDLPAGQAAVHHSAVMAAFDTFDITITGQGGHGAMPHMSCDPILAASLITTALQSVVSRNIDPQKAGVVSVTQIAGGNAYNIIPEKAELKGTTRSFCPDVRDQIEARMKTIVHSIAEAQGCKAEFNYSRRYPATINTFAEAELCRAVLESQSDVANVMINPPASMGGEDFAFMLEDNPGCYIWLGNGHQKNNYSLHNPNYDFNDQILPLGANYWVSLVEHFLNLK